MSEEVEETAQRIAGQGRDALLERLRPAFRDAAAAHADVITLSDEQIEAMVQNAADRADGLQWRRALAGVAVQELGIKLSEALDHPAVVRAQELVGAPSYEEAIAELRASGTGSPAPAAPEAAAEDAAEAVPEQPEAAEGEPQPAGGEQEGRGEPENASGPEAEGDVEGDGDAGEEGGLEQAGRRRDPRVVTLRAVHVEGLTDLDAADDDLRLRFSGRGLELLRQSDGAVLMRLRWREIHGLDLPHTRGLRRRHRGETRLVVQSDSGSATFTIPDATTDEVRTRLAPLHRVR